MDLNLNEYKAIVESSPNLIWRSGLDAKCNYFNQTWLDFTGRTFEQENGDGWVEGVHPDDVDRCIKTYMENFNKRTPFEMEYRLRRYDSKWRWINDRGVPFFNEKREFLGYIGSCMDVTEKVEGDMLKEMAQKDGLTGIFSRQYLLSLFDYEFESAKKTASKLSLAMMDIDKFKTINDTCGHVSGDAALKSFVSIVKDTVRQDDMFGRYGGDEFLIIFPNTPIETARKIIDRIRSSLKATTIKIGDNEIVISVSVGLCEKADENCPNELINKADKLMYEDKKRQK